MGSPPYGNKKAPPKGEPCLVIVVYCLSGEAFENIRMSYFGVSPLKGGDNVEEIRKLIEATATLLRAVAEILRIILKRD
jgi:hypothetical protein